MLTCVRAQAVPIYNMHARTHASVLLHLHTEVHVTLEHGVVGAGVGVRPEQAVPGRRRRGTRRRRRRRGAP
uniref:Uncharacterized protein n=1 Tax=Arundo donax TaxID=35708 RepID=A0A0A9FII0_ARUDO